MKITNLKETGFKGMPDIDMALPKMLFVTGNNGAGKTSFVNALNFALTGNAPDGDIVSKTSGKTSVSITFDDATVITREKTDATIVKYNGKRCTLKALNEAIENAVGIPMDSLKVASSSEMVRSMSPSEFSDFITKYLPEDIPVEEIIKLMDSADPDAIELVCDKFGESATFKDINSAYNDFFEKRKDAKRRYETCSNALQKINIDNDFVPDEKAVKEAEARYFEKRDLLTKYETEKKTAERNAAEREKQQKMIERLESEIKSLSGVSKPDESSRKNFDVQKQDIAKQEHTAASAIAAFDQTIRTLTKSLETISTPTCPLSEKITCKNVADKEKIKSKIETSIAGAKESRNEQNNLLLTLSKKKEELEKQLSDYINNQRLYERKSILMEQLSSQKKNLIKEIKMPKKPDISNIEPLKLAYEELKRQNDNFASYSKLKSENDDAKHDVEVFDYLVKAFAPKGKVTSTVIEKYMFNFNDICNETASMIKPGMELKFVSENGIRVLCRMPERDSFLSFEDLSSGEKILETLVVMDMISQLTGTGILSLDNLEQLDEGTFKTLLEAVKMLEDRYDHVILSCVKHKDLLAVAREEEITILDLG